MMRSGSNSAHLQRIAKQYFQPLVAKLAEVIRAGIADGEFRPVNPMQFIPSMVALVVFYFTSASIIGAAAGFDPLSPERIAERRVAVLDFVSAALFKTQQPAQGGGK
jgi:hypothetical protein